MKPPFRLVPDAISPDTVRALEQLLREARRGRIIGVAFVAMYKRREYIANATGEARRSPTFTRGMIASLDDALGRQADNPL
jgi:hypothetical protein